MHPVDCIKTLQQSNSGAGLNMLQASSRILSTQGVSGFYKGLGTYVTADGLAGSIKFATYEALKKYLKNNLSSDPKTAEQQERYGMFVAAGAAFIASSVVLVPGELIKQRMQMGQITSVSSGIKHILKTEGILGFFSGYGGVCFRDVPYTMLELGLYDNFKELYRKYKIRKGGEEGGRLTQVRTKQQQHLKGKIRWKRYQRNAAKNNKTQRETLERYLILTLCCVCVCFK